MANTPRTQRGSTDVTKRGTRKNASAGDLLPRAERGGSPKGGAAVYQHNQTDLEFLRAEAIRGGGSKNEVAIETLEIAHVGIKPR